MARAHRVFRTPVVTGCLTAGKKVQPVDRHSSKSALLPSTPVELAELAQQSRAFSAELTTMPTPDTTPRTLRRRFSRQEIEEIVSRYKAGDNTPALCRAYGISKGGILQLLRDEGVVMRKQPITPDDAQRAAQLYEGGNSITEIVDRISYSYSTVRKSLHESGVVMRSRGIKRSSLGKD